MSSKGRRSRRKATANPQAGGPASSPTQLVDPRDPEHARKNRRLMILLAIATLSLLVPELLERPQ